jgi:hypothetical protein
MEAAGIDRVLDRYNQVIRATEGDKPTEKVRRLIAQNAIQLTLEIREAVLKQAYNNLRSYFEESPVSSEPS